MYYTFCKVYKLKPIKGKVYVHDHRSEESDFGVPSELLRGGSDNEHTGQLDAIQVRPGSGEDGTDNKE